MLDFGARIYSFKCPGEKKGDEPQELTMQHKYLQEIVKDRDTCFGCTIGRYANRIANGKFSLDGKTYQLATNNGSNHLHGGDEGFDRKMWDAEEIINGHEVGVKFTYLSNDGEENYPGTLQVEARYTLTSDDELIMEFTATTDKPTILNLTNHAYWNLSGNIKEEGIQNHTLQLNCKKYVPVNDNMVPTGELADVAGTPLDFTNPVKLGDVLDKIPVGGKNGLDHCFAIDRTNVPFPDDCAEVGVLACGERKLIMKSNQLGIQFYTGNWLKGTDENGKPCYMKPHQVIAIEPQIFPNSPNVPRFPSPVLRPNKEYHHMSVYKFEGFKFDTSETDDETSS